MGDKGSLILELEARLLYKVSSMTASTVAKNKPYIAKQNKEQKKSIAKLGINIMYQGYTTRIQGWHSHTCPGITVSKLTDDKFILLVKRMTFQIS